MRRIISFLVTHGIAIVIGFGLGVYFLPILTAPPAPDATMLEEKAQGALFTGEFTRELRGSDFLHWGEGTISLTQSEIVHEGALAPGPDYKLYLTKEFVEHEDEFDKSSALQLGDIKTFEGFILPIAEGTDLAAYTTVVIWCESFGEFITAAKYR